MQLRDVRIQRCLCGLRASWALAFALLGGALGSACRGSSEPEPQRLPAENSLPDSTQTDDVQEARVRERIDHHQVIDDSAFRVRVFSMSYAEAEARLGPLHVEGTARFRLVRNGHDLEVMEACDIWSGPEGSVRVLQRGPDGALDREGIRKDGEWYFRNGPGSLRKADFVHRQMLQIHEQAFAPLGTFARLFGEDLILRQKGRETVVGQGAIRLDAQLGSRKPISFQDHRMQARRLRGSVWLHETTGVPIKARLEATLTVLRRPENAPEYEPGRLVISVERSVRRIEPKAFDVSGAVPPLVNPKVDLNPLAFLEASTKTSTVIGGD